jgi:hypothetical protein
MKVPVTTVDEHVKERILFMKIDVQGGEMDVLRGAAKSFDRGVDILHIEFEGQIEVIEFLHGFGYEIFDNRYLLIPKGKSSSYVETSASSFWNIEERLILSSGSSAYYAWPSQTPSDPCEYCQMFREQEEKSGCLIFTDIVPVRGDLAEGLGWLS